MAAERTGKRCMPQPPINYEGRYNLYLLVYSRTAFRVEIEVLDDLDEFYILLDVEMTLENHENVNGRWPGFSLDDLERTLSHIGRFV